MSTAKMTRGSTRSISGAGSAAASALLIGAGAVSPRRVVLWGLHSGEHELEVTLSDHSGRHGIRRRFHLDPKASPTFTTVLTPSWELEPGRRYQCRLAGRRGSATCRFRVPHEDRVKLGILSCHQPLDDEGELVATRVEETRRAVKHFEREDVDAVLLVGDQVYSDHPAPPEGENAAQLLKAYRQRYRNSWANPAWRELLSGFATLPAIDDHEIIDDWGSSGESLDDPRRHAALAAFDEFEGSRLRGRREGPPFDEGLRLGPVALFVTDLRSERATRDDRLRILSESQWDRLRAFEAAHRDASLLTIVCSVPPFYLPNRLAALGGRLPGIGSSFRDRWTHPDSLPELQRLSKLIMKWKRRTPSREIVLVSGDVHVGSAQRIEFDAGGCYQVVSSAVTAHPNWWQRLASSLAARVTRRVSGTESNTLARVRHLIAPIADSNVSVLECSPKTLRYRSFRTNASESEPAGTFEHPLPVGAGKAVVIPRRDRSASGCRASSG